MAQRFNMLLSLCSVSFGQVPPPPEFTAVFSLRLPLPNKRDQKAHEHHGTEGVPELVTLDFAHASPSRRTATIVRTLLSEHVIAETTRTVTIKRGRPTDATALCFDVTFGRTYPDASSFEQALLSIQIEVPLPDGSSQRIAEGIVDLSQFRTEGLHSDIVPLFSPVDKAAPTQRDISSVAVLCLTIDVIELNISLSSIGPISPIPNFAQVLARLPGQERCPHPLVRSNTLLLKPTKPRTSTQFSPLRRSMPEKGRKD